MGDPAISRHDVPGPQRRRDRHARRQVRPARNPGRSAGLCAQGLSGRGGPAILPARRRRHLRHRPGRPARPCGTSRRRGRLHPDPAARPHPVPEVRPHLQAEGAGGGARRGPGGDAGQGPGAGAVPEPHLLRRRRLWPGRRVPDLLRPSGAPAVPDRGGAAGCRAQRALAPGPDQRHGRRHGPRPQDPGGHAGRRLDHPGPVRRRPGDASGAGAPPGGGGGLQLHPRPGGRRGQRHGGRVGAGPGRAPDHRSKASGGGAGGGALWRGDPGQGPAGLAGRLGGPGVRWGDPRHGRGTGSRQERLQPRHPGPPPAGILVQGLRLWRRRRTRRGSQRCAPGRADRGQGLDT